LVNVSNGRNYQTGIPNCASRFGNGDDGGLLEPTVEKEEAPAAEEDEEEHQTEKKKWRRAAERIGLSAVRGSIEERQNERQEDV
jgi:hypothetical protein